MLKATSRKHRIEDERQDRINHENKLLYKKMTAILKKGTGHVSVSPIRAAKNSFMGYNDAGGMGNLRQDTDSVLLHFGRSVTARPSHQMIRRLAHERGQRHRE